MEFNQKFLDAVLPVLKALEKKLPGEFVVFGSAPLYLLGVAEFNDVEDLHDLDIVVKDDSVIPPRAKKVLFHNDPRQAIYKLRVKGMSVDVGAPWPGRKRIHKRIFKDPIMIEGFRFANLEIVREWKELMVKDYDREKDKAYLKKIKVFLRKQTKSKSKIVI